MKLECFCFHLFVFLVDFEARLNADIEFRMESLSIMMKINISVTDEESRNF